MRRMRLFRARKARGWTQAEVAKRLGITASFYGMIEQGVRNPRLPLALKLESIFGLPAAELFPDLFYDQEPNETFTAERPTGTEGGPRQ